MNAHLITFYVGTERDGNPAVSDQLFAIEDSRAMLADLFGGFTESYAVGGWLAGHVVREATIKWECVTNDEAWQDMAVRAAGILREVFNQQAVMWTATPVISGMVEE